MADHQIHQLVLLACMVSSFVCVGAITSSERAECLDAHNKYRALHKNTGKLTWSYTLAEGAQRWAEELLRNRGLTHSGGNYGENLYYGTSFNNGARSCTAAVDGWYNEIKYYDYATTLTTRADKQIGHFTQVVWRSSTQVGVGIASSTRNGVTTTFVVARYLPQGNFVMRQFGESRTDARRRVYGEEVTRLKSNAGRGTELSTGVVVILGSIVILIQSIF